jgi:hypothetical protein
MFCFLLDLLDRLDRPLTVDPKISEPPKARSKSPEEEDEFPKEKKPRSFLEDFFRRLADGAVKNDLKLLGLDLPRLRERSKFTLPEESD